MLLSCYDRVSNQFLSELFSNEQHDFKKNALLDESTQLSFSVGDTFLDSSLLLLLLVLELHIAAHFKLSIVYLTRFLVFVAVKLVEICKNYPRLRSFRDWNQLHRFLELLSGYSDGLFELLNFTICLGDLKIIFAHLINFAEHKLNLSLVVLLKSHRAWS